jgi:hypothetical protein
MLNSEEPFNHKCPQVTTGLPPIPHVGTSQKEDIHERAIIRNGELWTEITFTLPIQSIDACFMNTESLTEQQAQIARQKGIIEDTIELLKRPQCKPHPNLQMQNTGGAEFEVRFVHINQNQKGAPAFIGDQYIPWARDIFSPFKEGDSQLLRRASDTDRVISNTDCPIVDHEQHVSQALPNNGGSQLLLPYIITALKNNQHEAVKHFSCALIEAQPENGDVDNTILQEKADQLFRILLNSETGPHEELEALDTLELLLNSDAKKQLSLHIVPELGREQFEINASLLETINGDQFELLVRELRLHMSLATIFSASHDAMPFLTGSLISKLPSQFTKDFVYPKPRYDLLHAGIQASRQEDKGAIFDESYRVEKTFDYFAPDKPWEEENKAVTVTVNPMEEMVRIEDFQTKTIYLIENTSFYLESHNTANQTHDQPIKQEKYREAHHQTDIRSIVMSALSGCAMGFCEHDTGFNDNRTPIGWFGGVHPLHSDVAYEEQALQRPEGWLGEDDEQLQHVLRRAQFLPIGVEGSDKNLKEYDCSDLTTIRSGIESIKGYYPAARTTYHLDEQTGSVLRRPESRSASAGPTVEDMVANIAFEWGLSEVFAEYSKAHHGLDLNQDATLIEDAWPYDQVRQSRRQVERFGLHTLISWFPKSDNGGFKNLRQVIVEELVPLACEGLRRRGFSEKQIEHYIGSEERPGIIMRRLNFTIPEEVDGVPVREALSKKVRDTRQACLNIKQNIESLQKTDQKYEEPHSARDIEDLETLRLIQEQLMSLQRLSEYLGEEGQPPKRGISPSDGFRIVRDIERLIRGETTTSDLTGYQMLEEIKLRQADLKNGASAQVRTDNPYGVDIATWLNGYLRDAALRLSQ